MKKESSSNFANYLQDPSWIRGTRSQWTSVHAASLFINASTICGRITIE